MSDIRLICGEALATLKTLPDASVDSVCTDPPAGIEFMGRDWDSFKGDKRQSGDPKFHKSGAGPFDRATVRYGYTKNVQHTRGLFVAFLTEIMSEALRVAKPGAYALVWAIPRTSHWTGMAIEDAGWVIQDRISHLFGQGFPKHKSKLKPACEDWWLAWKPDRYATPLPGLDACRIEGAVPSTIQGQSSRGGECYGKDQRDQREFVGHTQGRWPANIVLSHTPECVCTGSTPIKANGHHPKKRGKGRTGTAGHAGQDGLTERHADGEVVETWQCSEDCPVRLLDEQSGESRSAGGRIGNKDGGEIYGGGKGLAGAYTAGDPGFGDTGGASRFFYTAKAGRAERNVGCEDLPEKACGTMEDDDYSWEGEIARGRKPRDAKRRNTHPTVKPVDLMRWLCRLITPPGGTVLDCFAGSGSTALACLAESFGFLGIEREAEYVEIARRRIAGVQGPLFAD